MLCTRSAGDRKKVFGAKVKECNWGAQRQQGGNMEGSEHHILNKSNIR